MSPCGWRRNIGLCPLLTRGGQDQGPRAQHSKVGAPARPRRVAMRTRGPAGWYTRPHKTGRRTLEPRSYEDGHSRASPRPRTFRTALCREGGPPPLTRSLRGAQFWTSKATLQEARRLAIVPY
eukprot:2914531-Pyramimonas_sp.AAC.1